MTLHFPESWLKWDMLAQSSAKNHCNPCGQTLNIANAETQ